MNAWYLYEVEGEPVAAARSDWPTSTTVEVWNLRDQTWTPRDVAQELAQDPDWVEVPVSRVDTWIAHARRT